MKWEWFVLLFLVGMVAWIIYLEIGMRRLQRKYKEYESLVGMVDFSFSKEVWDEMTDLNSPGLDGDEPIFKGYKGGE